MYFSVLLVFRISEKLLIICKLQAVTQAVCPFNLYYIHIECEIYTATRPENPEAHIIVMVFSYGSVYGCSGNSKAGSDELPLTYISE